MSEGAWHCTLRTSDGDRDSAGPVDDGGSRRVPEVAPTPDRIRADAAVILAWAELLAGEVTNPEVTSRGLIAIERAAAALAAQARAALSGLASGSPPTDEQFVIEVDLPPALPSPARSSPAPTAVVAPEGGVADAALVEADIPCLVFDREGVLLFINETAGQLIGRRGNNVVGSRLGTLDAADSLSLRAVVSAALTSAGPVAQDLDMTCPDGLRHTFDCRASRIANGGVVVWLHDCCEHRATEARLVHEALHDPLTGLANRRLATDRLRHALLRSRRSLQSVGVLFVDLDRFKPINDIYGHIAGDAVIVQCAQRLQHTVRPGDTVSRYGGDEFLVICEGIVAPDQLDTVADRLEAALAERSAVGGDEIVLGATVGRALATTGDSTPEELIFAADRDMYRRREDRAAGARR